MALDVNIRSTTNVWFGTRGSAIFHAHFDATTGELTNPTTAADIPAPGFLCVNQAQTLLYSLVKPDASDQLLGNAEVAAYRIVENKLKLLGSSESGIGKGSHLALSRDERTLLVAHYGAGKISSFSLDDDGSILEPVSRIVHSGSSVNADRQASPHPHWVGASPDGQFVMVPDLGLDQIVIYRINEATHELSAHGATALPPGQGPRHLKFHPNAKWAYVINELGLTVTSLEYDSNQGTLTPMQTVEALAQSDLKDVLTLGSEIRVHPTGKFVYAGIRGHDVIAVFSVDDATGQLQLIEREPIRGSWPRNFAIDPSGKWLLAAGAESQTISVFSIDQDSGKLTFTRKVVNVPECICVAFSL